MKTKRTALLLSLILFSLPILIACGCEHEYDVGKITQKPTCIEHGVKTYTCKLCGSIKTEEIPLGDHDYREEITKEATCTEAGITTLTCKVCGNVTTEEIPVRDHYYTSEVTQEPTYTETGIKTYTCTLCGNSYTESIPVKPPSVEVNVIGKWNRPKDTSNWIFSDMSIFTFRLTNWMPKTVKGIEGVLVIRDMFDKEILQMQADLTGYSIAPGQSITIDNMGLEINQFMDEDVRLYNTRYEDLKFEYQLESIVYTDGTIEKV